MANHYSALSKEEILKILNTNFELGLDEEEAALRLRQNGPNSFGSVSKLPILTSIFNQVKSPLVMVLVAAAGISLFLRDLVDFYVIFAALSINLLIGVLQEKKADDSFRKLADSQQKFATVKRSGKKKVIPAEDLVKGDVVYLEGGMLVPADLRLITENDLKVDESALTGEWVSVSKESEKQKVGQPLSLQFNMAFMGTVVVSGEAIGVVVRTGQNAEVGKIASSLSSIQNEKTPLEKNIKKISSLILRVTIVAVLFIVIVGILQGREMREMFLVAVATAVSVVPEGLPAAVTVVLAIGMERILKKGGLVKNLLAAETLGSTTVILTDKTGTITEGKMKLKQVYTLNSILTQYLDLEENKEVLKTAVLASDGFVEERAGEIIVRGRPVEKAIVGAGLDAGISQSDLTKSGNKRLDFVAFNSERRFMASLNESVKWPNRIYFSGEPEKLLRLSTHALKGLESHVLTSQWKEALTNALKKATASGYRLTAVAYKDVPWKKIPDSEKNAVEGLVFVGFLAFTDPVRKDVPVSIEEARGAGARVIMLTGDHPETAAMIAKESGIMSGDSAVITGQDLEGMTDKELYGLVKRTSVFARVLPEQKLRISQVLRDYGEIVAMTGDGVNDAAALRGADIGIAVGSGTEVAKGASDLVLIDNSFSVIIRAIEEGRRIMDNLRKIVGYLLATSSGEVLLIMAALALALPIPILPAQILWLNILGEGFLNFAFAFEEKDRNLMKRKPSEDNFKSILPATLRRLVITVALTTSVLLVILYLILLAFGTSIEEIRTLIFIAISTSSLLFAFSFRNIAEPIWRISFSSNKYLLGALGLSFVGLILSLSVPFLRNLLSLVELDAINLAYLSIFGLINLAIIESFKALFSKSAPQQSMIKS